MFNQPLNHFIANNNNDFRQSGNVNVAMRPIVNGIDYLKTIKQSLQKIILADNPQLVKSGLATEKYELVNDYGYEPDTSILHELNLEATEKIMQVMRSICLFKNKNPLQEGFVVTEIDVHTYRSIKSKNHYFHNIVFSAVNTTRYNTVTFKAQLYQSYGVVYVANISLLNDICDDNSDCSFSGQFNEYLSPINRQEESRYDVYGNLLFSDSGPPDIENLIKEMSKYTLR